MEPKQVAFIYYLENRHVGHAFIYVLVDGVPFRIGKQRGAAECEILRMESVDALRVDARTINRMNPAYENYETLQMAPFSATELCKLIAALGSKGYFMVAEQAEKRGRAR